MQFLGYSGSGKTFSIVALTSRLSKAGKKVATVKHVHDQIFTIDTPGKDSWKFAQAGASIGAVIAPKEFTLVRRGETNRLNIATVVKNFEREGIDYAFVEGFYKQLRSYPGIIRVLCSTNKGDVHDLLANHGERVAFVTGMVAKRRMREVHGIPLLDLPRDTSRALKLIDES